MYLYTSTGKKLGQRVVPQDGENARPRGRSTDQPAPARHEQRYGASSIEATATNDGADGRAWHEASVGTIAMFDASGQRLRTLYFGQMPEAGKKTLAECVTVELEALLAERPGLDVCFASDGAPLHWKLLGAIHERLPRERVGEVKYIVDFFHVAEYLQEAAGPGARAPRAGGRGASRAVRRASSRRRQGRTGWRGRRRAMGPLRSRGTWPCQRGVDEP